MKLMEANRIPTVSLIRKLRIRPWSPRRCIRSPVIFVSKKRMGRLISFRQKSETRARSIRVLTCKAVQLCKKPTAMSVKVRINCEMRIRTTIQVVVPDAHIHHRLGKEREDKP